MSRSIVQPVVLLTAASGRKSTFESVRRSIPVGKGRHGRHLAELEEEDAADFCHEPTDLASKPCNLQCSLRLACLFSGLLWDCSWEAVLGGGGLQHWNALGERYKQACNSDLLRRGNTAIH